MGHDAGMILPLLGQNRSLLSALTKNVMTQNRNTIHSIIGQKHVNVFQNISSHDKLMLRDRYKEELILFGYDFNIKTNEIGCEFTGIDEKCC